MNTTDITNLSSFNLANYLDTKRINKQDIDLELLVNIFPKIDINATTKRGVTAFMIGLLFDNIELTKLFLSYGIDVNATSIYYADKAYYLELVNDHHPHPTPPPFVENLRIHPISFLMHNKTYNSQHIRLLVEAGLDIDERVNSVWNIQNGILCDDAYSGYETDSLIASAIYNNDTELVKWLLQKGSKLNTTISLDNIIKNENFELLQLLVKTNPNMRISNSPLPLLAVEHKEIFYEIAHFLIKNGLDVNAGSPLQKALNVPEESFGGVYINIKMVYLLVENGANVNDIDKDGKSILMHACGAKNQVRRNERDEKFKIVKLLIEHGANIHHKDKSRNSVLFYLEDDRIERIDFYTESDEDYNYLPVFPSEQILNLLLDNGADINAKNNMGMTPLMHYALKEEDRLVKILLENGADINAKSEMTAFDLTGSDAIKDLIKSTKNNNPQKVVKILSNFTIDTPFKLTTHLWEDPKGELFDKYGSFDGYMNAVKKQFESIKDEMEELSPNLYKKISSFLVETTPDEEYSWCSTTPINIGWSSLNGLKEWCDSGKLPKDFKLPNPIFMGRKQIATFGEIIDLFKEEIEVRAGYKIPNEFNIEVSKRDFYTDTQKFSSVLGKIFAEMKKRVEYPQIEVTSKELNDRSIEIKITQIGSFGDKNAHSMLEEVNDGDFADIKASLTNLCDWSIESNFEDESFRLNFLHSNNVKDIEILESKPKGFTHILRFYK